MICIYLPIIPPLTLKFKLWIVCVLWFDTTTIHPSVTTDPIWVCLTLRITCGSKCFLLWAVHTWGCVATYVSSGFQESCLYWHGGSWTGKSQYLRSPLRNQSELQGLLHIKMLPHEGTITLLCFHEDCWFSCTATEMQWVTQWGLQWHNYEWKHFNKIKRHCLYVEIALSQAIWLRELL